MAYAKKTEVSVEQTEAEIKKLLKKHKATAIVTGTDSRQAMVMCEIAGWRLRFSIPAPDPADYQKQKINQHSTTRRTPAQIEAAVDQAWRAKWRLLLLLLKAKLELIESGATVIEQEFLAYIVLPNNQTAGEWLEPQLQSAYRSGKMPPFLPGAPIVTDPPKDDPII